jgi:RimJ/RimL family protein N-acetyltransferase
MLFSERLRLRAIEREDLPRFVTWFNDPEVTRGLLRFLPLSLIQEEKWFENQLQQPEETQPLAIEVRSQGAWRHIGAIGFHQIDWRNRSGDIGIVIGEKSCWNQGYGTEATGLLIKHGFDTLNLHRISLRVFENNRRAIKCYEKLGFVVEGRLRHAMYREGRYLDEILMSILRPEWQARAPVVTEEQADRGD